MCKCFGWMNCWWSSSHLGINTQHLIHVHGFHIFIAHVMMVDFAAGMCLKIDDAQLPIRLLMGSLLIMMSVSMFFPMVMFYGSSFLSDFSTGIMRMRNGIMHQQEGICSQEQ